MVLACERDSPGIDGNKDSRHSEASAAWRTSPFCNDVETKGSVMPAILEDNMLVSAVSLPNTNITLELWDVTPQVAEAWLQMARPNRKLVPARVKHYSRLMASGQWRVNGEPLIFNHRGQLMNGTHRLHALGVASLTIRMLVIRGIEDDTYETIDTGRARQASDVLSLIDGIEDPQSIAAALTWLWQYQLSDGDLATARIRPTNAEVVKVLESNVGLPASLNMARKTQKLLGRGTGTFLHYVFAQKDLAAADAFFEALSTGTNLEPGRAVLVLRETLLDDRKSKRKMSSLYRVALTIRAFNYERRGQVVKSLRWRTKGQKPEAFPTIE